MSDKPRRGRESTQSLPGLIRQPEVLRHDDRPPATHINLGEDGGGLAHSDELSIDCSHVKAHSSASGSKRGSLKKRSAARGAEGRARFMALADDSRQTGRFRADVRKRRRRRHGHSAFRRRGKTNAPAGGQGLRRRQFAQMAKAKEDPSGHSPTASRRTPYPLDRAAYKAPERHRTPVLQAEELATRRNPIRPTCSKPSLRPRSRRYHDRVGLLPVPWTPR